MKTRSAIAALTLFVFAAVTQAQPTPAPKRPKGKAVASAHQRASTVPGATGLFVLQLRQDGSVEKVVIARSTGNKNIDAWTAKGLSFMRFRPEELTKTELAKRQKILPVTITEEQLRNARYLPQPQW